MPSGLQTFRLPKSGTLSLLCIEHHTQAWRWTKRGLDALRQKASAKFNVKIEVQQELEGFSAICELARAGFGHGLVPLGITKALGIKPSALVHFPKPGVSIPVSLFGRKSTLARKEIEDLYTALKSYSSKL